MPFVYLNSQIFSGLSGMFKLQPSKHTEISMWHERLRMHIKEQDFKEVCHFLVCVYFLFYFSSLLFLLIYGV
jgi:hypothetical protein